jgi:hypothetical protein
LPLVDAVDMVSYDFKAFDPEIHLTCTGVDNRLILENAKTIAATGKPILARMVIVPTRNDQPEDIRKRLDLFTAWAVPYSRSIFSSITSTVSAIRKTRHALFASGFPPFSGNDRAD